MDPLTVFKDFVNSKQLEQVEVDESGGKVRFADKYSFPASAATAFRREGTALYYPLGVVVQFFKWHVSGERLAAYIKTYPNRNDQVALPDREVRGPAAGWPQLLIVFCHLQYSWQHVHAHSICELHSSL